MVPTSCGQRIYSGPHQERSEEGNTKCVFRPWYEAQFDEHWLAHSKWIQTGVSFKKRMGARTYLQQFK